MTTELGVTIGWSFWIDRGGTFTDVIGRAPDGGEQTLKLLSASPSYADAAVEAMRRLLEVEPGAPFPAERVAAIKMGTTVATNALLERKGARTLLLVTEGFADALLIGDQSRPELFALDVIRPDPLYSGVAEANERLAADGAVVRPLDEAALAQRLSDAKAEGYEAIAIAFLHSDLNPAHELKAGEIARAAGFAHVTLSHEASPLPRYVARAETAVADAYLTPVLQAYVRRVSQAVNGAPLWFMTSAGGLVRAEAFRGKDAVVSGPAGGVVGVARTAQAAGAAAVLGFDMGGTSTDVCRYAGALERRDTAKVAGARLRSPMLDVETVAAGGGSILTFDGFRARVGPHSAGADPGPACYGRGGPATVTDANLVLGRLDPLYFPLVFGPHGDGPLDVEAAQQKLAELADAMNLPSAEAAAEGFLAVAVEQMAQAVRRISTERGFDPRGHALVAFGGAAGQCACQVADALGVEEVLSPRYASLLSAWGIGQARVRVLRQAGLEKPLGEALEEAEVLAGRLAMDALAGMAEQGAETGATEQRLMLRYDGADAVLAVPLSDTASAKAAFESAHQRLFGFVEPERTILIGSVEVEVEAAGAGNEKSLGPRLRGDERKEGTVVRAEDLTEAEGPVLIVRGDTQIAVADGWRARGEADGLIRLTRTRPLSTAAIAADKPDPVTLELFNRRFMGVAEAMGAALERTAHSVNIKERLDFSCALFDADGGLVANAPHMPVHLGSMGASVRAVQVRHPVLKPGDAFALNNPYFGGTHLPDITVVMPIFMEGETPAFYVAARGHHADVGGVQPGSMPPFSRTIDEEGVMLDAVPIMRDGRFLQDDTLAALKTGQWPARSPDRNIADLKAQIAACQAGAQAVSGMIEAHGAQTVARYMGFVQQNAEAAVRRALGRLTDGEARVPLDGAGEIVVTIKVDSEAREAVLDFRQSADQLDTNFNAPSAIVSAAALYVFRTLVDDDIPLNAGCLAPLNILTREGSMLDPKPPAAVVAGNVETSQHVVDALYAALGVMANGQGTMNNFTFGDETRQYYETICGGAGATATRDGTSGVHIHMTNSRLTDPEILERRFPVRVESFGVRHGSGGAGLRRGGDGAVRRIRFLAPMEAALLSSRRENAPQGIAGGGPALAGRQRLIAATGAVKELAGCFSVTVEPGDVIEIETPGGGGFGKPA
ncbi:5-oxoprolinase (ATP-hydrolyzing) [Caulobacter ginsengisoli]|uniref:5-oxoprolinase (ATP-hydrolyzing) n=1 Tax=Caulobacter ginsengisoli TaxID=400775 RepID=A0ABU0INK9_9CAUL|nr:hydantoinase B/oxoprolinase family protein [Caulobacter ginsengisoli]MDQ0463584.1 5-oxoprolinase (ATP-hydrolyzing) [Caulobacter ginsengisoli]